MSGHAILLGIAALSLFTHGMEWIVFALEELISGRKLKAAFNLSAALSAIFFAYQLTEAA